MSAQEQEGTGGSGGHEEAAYSSVRDEDGTPAWQLFPADHVRPDGLPAVVTDPAQLRTPLLRRILRVLREEFDPEFVLRWLGPLPIARLRRPLSQARVAMITTAGLHVKGDRPFDPYSRRWGDPGYRLIPHLAPPGDLDLAADYVDGKYVRNDPEVALPMRALQHWVAEGIVGSAAARHVSFCEGVVRPFPGLVESTREVVGFLRSDGVDAAILLPTCSLCVLNTCVIAREVEAGGVSTSTITLLPELTDIVGAPRSLGVKFPFGAPCGDPGNAGLHQRVVGHALERLEQASAWGLAIESNAVWRS